MEDAPTLTIKYSDIPSYLHGSDFYQNLSSDDPERIIEVPSDCFHLDGSYAANLDEFKQLLRVMVFWMLEEVPAGVERFCDENEASVWEEAMHCYANSMNSIFKQRSLMGTITVKYRDIPPYLRAGQFYRNLDPDDPDDIEIPRGCYKARDDEPCEDEDDFEHLLRIMSFWMLDSIPVAILNFCDRLEVDAWEESVADIPDTSTMLPALLTAYTRPNNPNTFVQKVVDTGRWELIVHFIDRFEKTSGSAAVLAASLGHLKLLQYVHTQGFEWDEDTCAAASERGHTDCLKYAHNHGCPWDVRAYTLAASAGHLPCLQFAHERSLEWSADVSTKAAQNGHIDCLQYAHESGCPWDFSVYTHAAQFGHIHCMRYAHQQALGWHPDVCKYAAMSGQLRCLRFAHANGCPWDAGTVSAAAQEGHGACLEYALVQGCPAEDFASCVASSQGHLQCLQLLHEYNAPWSEKTAFNAAGCQDIVCLQYLCESGCPWNADVTTLAAQLNRVDTLRYAMERGCTYNKYILYWMVQKRHFECLRFLVEDQLLPMDENLFIFTLLTGNLACLQYLMDMGCPYLEAELYDDYSELQVYDQYFKKENPELEACVEYVAHKGWVVDEYLTDYIISRDPSCVGWLIKAGYF